MIDEQSIENSKPNIDSKGRVWRTHKDKIEELADLMNSQSIHPMQASDELFHIFDAVLSTEEIEFMLKMGGGKHSLDNLKARIDLSDEQIITIVDKLVYKGPIAIIKDQEGNEYYNIMSIFPGWFELYLMRGEETAESKLFAERVEQLFEAAYRFGNEEVINELMRDVGPHIKVLAAKDPQTTTISINQDVGPHENLIFSTKSILSVMKELPDDEIITVGNCFCRFEKQLIGDPCRTHLPLETCISIGPAAEHLMKQGIAKQITKADALERIQDFQNKGAIHQTTMTIPTKDFQAKYPFDIFCNCCWDCCGIIGNYNRGYLPYILKSYHRAIIHDEELCTACGTCVEYCPVRAIEIGSSGKAEINSSLCIGCGQCYHHCSFGVIELEEDEREVFLPMLDKSQARIQPKVYDDGGEEISLDDSAISDREEVLATLNQTRERMTIEENVKAFKKWNKNMAYYFTDLDEYMYFEISNGVPGPIKEGKIDIPRYFLYTYGKCFHWSDERGNRWISSF